MTDNDEKMTINEEIVNKLKSKIKKLRQKTEGLFEETKKLDKEKLYLQADIINQQKMSEKTIVNSRNNIRFEIMNKLLPILDMVHSDSHLLSSSFMSDIKNLTHKELENSLDVAKKSFTILIDFIRMIFDEKLDIKSYDGIGENFDPTHFDATGFDENGENNKIIRCVMPGYTSDGAVLRKAVVIVGKKIIKK